MFGSTTRRSPPSLPKRRWTSLNLKRCMSVKSDFEKVCANIPMAIASFSTQTLGGVMSTRPGPGNAGLGPSGTRTSVPQMTGKKLAAHAPEVVQASSIVSKRLTSGGRKFGFKRLSDALCVKISGCNVDTDYRGPRFRVLSGSSATSPREGAIVQSLAVGLSRSLTNQPYFRSKEPPSSQWR